VSGQQPAPRLEQATEQRAGHGEGRVGHHVVGAAREAKVPGVSLHDDHRLAESTMEVAGALWMCFDGDDAGARVDERSRECSEPGAHVDDGGTSNNGGVGDEPSGPLRVELVPSPPPP